MGNFYVSFAAFGVESESLAQCLDHLSRTAFVAPSIGEVTVFYDREADGQNDKQIHLVGSGVSRDCNCPVLAVWNHDDDVLYYHLFDSGASVSEYDSFPGYFSDGDRTPLVADATALCRAFGRADQDTIEEVDAILTEEDDYVFALDRHKELADQLQIPWKFACLNYSNIASGTVFDGVDVASFRHVIA